MKSLDELLNRLLTLAARAPALPLETMPWTLEARILAAWRSIPREDPWADLVPTLRWGVALASCAVIGALVWFSSIGSVSQDEITLLDNAVNMLVMR